MKSTAAFIALIMLFIAIPAKALSSGGPGGWWPKSWPKELEPLRKQAWTWSHGRIHQGISYGSYEIEFKNRDQFEAAWPHILKLHGKDVPVTLVRGPRVLVWKTRPPKGQIAGVRILTSSKANNRPPQKINLKKPISPPTVAYSPPNAPFAASNWSSMERSSI